MNATLTVRASIVMLLAFAYVMIGESAAARAGFTWEIVPLDPMIVDESAYADLTYTIKILTTDESILVSKISANYMFDSGPDQNDLPISPTVLFVSKAPREMR